MQVPLSPHLVLLLLRVGQQVVVSDLLGIIHLVVLDLVQVHTLRKLVGLTESDHRHLVLASQVADHA